MHLSNLSLPLPVKSIDFRIQSINKKGGATILAYKDARVDQQRLDDVVGPQNWQRQHTRDNANCQVGIWNDAINQWIWKEDTGTESFTEAEKGLASDSFKRACFNWGIGRELYDYPQILIWLNDDEWEMAKNRQGKDQPRSTWNLKLKEWKWYSEFTGRQITFLAAQDNHGKTRFTWGKKGEGSPPDLIPVAEVK